MISIIIPVYNVKLYLDNCIQSVIQQSYTDFECILVDDGSTDGSSEICDQWAEKDNRIIIVHQPNGGVSSARNKGLEQAKGEYICFIDSDDWVDAVSYTHLDVYKRQSYMYPPPGLPDILMKVWNAGYQPVIAHPERYLYMEEKDYLLLKEKGYSFQLNLMSLSGYYGPHPKVVSEKLLKQKMYDFVGTDLHHLERYRPMLDQLRLTRRQLEALEGLIANNARI